MTRFGVPFETAYQTDLLIEASDKPDTDNPAAKVQGWCYALISFDDAGVFQTFGTWE